jgi:outer membrane receptor protein involved in Fe transport
MMRYPDVRTLLTSTVAIYALAVSAPAQAQMKSFNVPAQPAASGIPELARQADVQILVSESAARGKTTRAVKGSMTVDKALRRLLEGTGLRISSSDGRTFTLTADAYDETPARGEAEAGSAAADNERADIVVTGTRIQGAPTTYPVIRLTAEQMRQQGFNTIGDAVRALPQNFNGGQNPGVALGSSGIANQNNTGASALNLRGLGPDATLTLVNGRRLSYDGYSQAVDLSIVPVAALDRLEIVADGASAIYGSDAVGGVANIILKRDYEGLSVSARAGGATEGGDFQQEYSAVTGRKWSTGGFIVTYDYSSNGYLKTSQRDYTSSLYQPNSLINKMRTHAAIFSAHQAIGGATEFSVDASYNNRVMDNVQRTSTTSISAATRASKAFQISPSIKTTIIPGWIVSLYGTYGTDKNYVDSYSYTNAGVATSYSNLCYCNKSESVEGSATGDLFSLPAGKVRLAAGIGYRKNDYVQHYTTSTSSNFVGSRSSVYEFGELFVPLVSPEQGSSFLRSASVSAALRHEDYSDFGNVVTPKIGLTLSPTSDFDLKGSWGKSYKTPTLLQQYSAFSTYLYTATQVGATGYPANSTAILLYGGNRDLKPERARTWTGTITFHPRAVKGLKIDASYFNIYFKDRIVQPVSYTSAFSNPIYQSFLVLNPSAALQQSYISAAPAGLRNNTAITYDPANVIGLISDQYLNASVQKIHGVDFTTSYDFSIGSSLISLDSQLSWIHSNQQTGPSSPTFQLAGTTSNPPKFRARGTASLTHGSLNITTALNYIGGVTNTSVSPAQDGDSMTTTDITLSIHSPERHGVLNGISASLSVSNLFNVKPPYMYSRLPYGAPYDSTNYSAIGRFLSFTLSKNF